MTPRRLLCIALLACFTAALFGAAPLAAWVEASIAGGTVVQQAADTWLGVTRRIGLGGPYDALRRGMRDLEGAH